MFYNEKSKEFPIKNENNIIASVFHLLLLLELNDIINTKHTKENLKISVPLNKIYNGFFVVFEYCGQYNTVLIGCIGAGR